VVASAIVQLPIGLGLTGALRRHVAYQELRALLPLSVVGLVGGTIALASLDVDGLKRLCGAVTALFALRMLRRTQRGAAPSAALPAWTGYLAGLLGGVLGGVFGTSGPPVVLVLERRLPQKLALRATLLSYFLALNTLRVFAYIVSFLVTWQVLVVSLAMLPAAALGAFLGTRMQHRVGERGFRLAVSLVLLLTGLALMFGR
jgi:uncharacterized protein